MTLRMSIIGIRFSSASTSLPQLVLQHARARSDMLMAHSSAQRSTATRRIADATHRGNELGTALRCPDPH